MTNALITVMESPQLPLEFDVTAPAAAALIARGWKPPEDAEAGLPGFESSKHPAAEADDSQDEADQDHPADEHCQRSTRTDSSHCQEDPDAGDEQAGRNESRARAFGLGFPHFFHGLSIAQETTDD